MKTSTLTYMHMNVRPCLAQVKSNLHSRPSLHRLIYTEHWLLFKPLYNGHFLLSPSLRWLLWRGSIAPLGRSMLLLKVKFRLINQFQTSLILNFLCHLASLNYLWSKIIRASNLRKPQEDSNWLKPFKPGFHFNVHVQHLLLQGDSLSY